MCCIIFSWHGKQRGKIIYFQLQKVALEDHTGSALNSRKSYHNNLVIFTSRQEWWHCISRHGNIKLLWNLFKLKEQCSLSPMQHKVSFSPLSTSHSRKWIYWWTDWTIDSSRLWPKIIWRGRCNDVISMRFLVSWALLQEHHIDQRHYVILLLYIPGSVSDEW